jgi:hypothetical protein
VIRKLSVRFRAPLRTQLFCLISPIITSLSVLRGFLDFVQKHTDICKMKKTNTKWFATTINFRKCKTTRKALEMMQLLGGE